MKTIRKSLAQWAAKLAGTSKSTPARKASSGPKPLDESHLRQVSAGDGGAPQVPKGNW